MSDRSLRQPLLRFLTPLLACVLSLTVIPGIVATVSLAPGRG